MLCLLDITHLQSDARAVVTHRCKDEMPRCHNTRKTIHTHTHTDAATHSTLRGPTVNVPRLQEGFNFKTLYLYLYNVYNK